MPKHRFHRSHRDANVRKIPYKSQTNEMRIIKKTNYRPNAPRSMSMVSKWSKQWNQKNLNHSSELYLNVSRTFGRVPSINASEIDELLGHGFHHDDEIMDTFLASVDTDLMRSLTAPAPDQQQHQSPQYTKEGFGYFNCDHCFNRWTSAHADLDYWQICDCCCAQIFPSDVIARNGIPKKHSKPHMRGHCQKCLMTGRFCNERNGNEANQWTMLSAQPWLQDYLNNN